MNEAPRILFVSHEATRTGAPMVLLHLVRWLRDNSTIEPEIVTMVGGPLTPEFAEVGITHVLSDRLNSPSPTLAEAALRRLRLNPGARALLRRRMRRKVTGLGRADLVYLNSGASLRLLHHLPRPESVIAHIHELRTGLRWALQPADPPLLQDRVDHFVVVADRVGANLANGYGIDPAKISRIYEFVDAAAVHSDPAAATTARASLGLTPETPIVGGAGFADWRKGVDLFVHLARRMMDSGRTEVHFVWVGERAGGLERAEIDAEIARLGVDTNLHFVGPQSPPFGWYRAFDVFALTSREDPYPLVGLETALLGVPMVCFDAGGMTELIDRGPAEGLGEVGLVVPYIDVGAMASAVTGLLDDDDRRRSMGSLAHSLVARDHDVSVAGPQVLDVIERVAGRALR